jgi:hypothetical protein
MFIGNGLGVSGLVEAGLRVGREQAMGQQLQPWRSGTWRSGNGQTLWLSMLVEAMEQVSRPDVRAVPCDRLVLAALRAQLERPASPYAYCGSQFSLRN